MEREREELMGRILNPASMLFIRVRNAILSMKRLSSIFSTSSSPIHSCGNLWNNVEEGLPMKPQLDLRTESYMSLSLSLALLLSSSLFSSLSFYQARRIGNETAIGSENRESHLSGPFIRLGLHSPSNCNFIRLAGVLTVKSS